VHPHLDHLKLGDFHTATSYKTTIYSINHRPNCFKFWNKHLNAIISQYKENDMILATKGVANGKSIKILPYMTAGNLHQPRMAEQQILQL